MWFLAASGLWLSKKNSAAIAISLIPIHGNLVEEFFPEIPIWPNLLFPTKKRPLTSCRISGFFCLFFFLGQETHSSSLIECGAQRKKVVLGSEIFLGGFFQIAKWSSFPKTTLV